MERKGEHEETEEKRIGRKRYAQRKNEKVSKGETKKEREKLINKKDREERKRQKEIEIK